MKMVETSKVAILLLLVSAALAGCGGDDAAGQFADLGAYCQRSAAFNTAVAGTNTEGLPAGDQVRTEAARAALEGLGPSAEELQDVAPGDVRGDLATAIEAIRAASEGDLELVNAPEYEEARQKLVSFSSAEGPQGSSSGDL